MVQYKTLTLQSQYRDPSGHFAAPGWYVPNQRVPAGMINKAQSDAKTFGRDCQVQ